MNRKAKAALRFAPGTLAPVHRSGEKMSLGPGCRVHANFFFPTIFARRQGGLQCHPNSQGNTFRWLVGWIDERNEFGSAEFRKTVIAASCRRLRRITVMPMRPAEQVTDFDFILLAYILQNQPTLSDKLTGISQADCP